MPKLIDLSTPPDGRHSFLYWLVIPVFLAWLAAGYLIGAVKDRPRWLNFVSLGPTSNIVPYQVAFSPLPQSNSGYLTLWFDDAWLSQYLIAYPLFQKFGFPGVVAVPSAAIEQPAYMNWAQLQILQKSGWEIANHGVSHDCQMHTWSADRIRQEYRASKLVLWKHQLSSDIFVTPCGVDSQTMRDEAAKVFLAYRTVESGQNDLSKLDLLNLRVRNLDDHTTLDDIRNWIDTARNSNHWLILVFHKLGKKNDTDGWEKYELDSDSLARILNYIKETGISVVVPSQIISAFIK